MKQIGSFTHTTRFNEKSKKAGNLLSGWVGNHPSFRAHRKTTGLGGQSDTRARTHTHTHTHTRAHMTQFSDAVNL